MKKIIISCLLIMVLVFGIDLIQRNIAPKQSEVYSLSDYYYNELESGTIYKADDLTVVDKFAQQTQTAYGQTTRTTDFYLVTFRDKNDHLVAAILSVDDNDDIFYQLSSYAIDESQYIGDCVLNGYVLTRGTANAELTQYFDEAINKYGPVLNEYIVSPRCMLKYHCNATEDPLKK